MEEKNMELNDENINKVANILKARGLIDAKNRVDYCFNVAKHLIEQHPELTADKLGELYEQQMEQENAKQTQENEGQEIDD